MVGEYLDEGIVVLWLDQVIDRAGREFGKGIVSGSEDGEGAGAFECVDQAGSLDGGNESLVDGGWTASELMASAAPATRVIRDFFMMCSLSK